MEIYLWNFFGRYCGLKFKRIYLLLFSYYEYKLKNRRSIFLKRNCDISKIIALQYFIEFMRIHVKIVLMLN